MSTNKLFCTECDWRGTEDQMLIAPNPFASDGDNITGCPACSGVEILEYACEHKDCWERFTCGTPTLSGYAQTCFKHTPAKAVATT